LTGISKVKQPLLFSERLFFGKNQNLKKTLDAVRRSNEINSNPSDTPLLFSERLILKTAACSTIRMWLSIDAVRRPKDSDRYRTVAIQRKVQIKEACPFGADTVRITLRGRSAIQACPFGAGQR